MKENISTHNNSDIISIRELIISIWDGRWFILAFALLSLIFSAGYIYISSKQFRAELKIHPVPISHFDNYSEFNHEAIISVSRAELLERFIEKLNNSDIIYKAFQKAFISDSETKPNSRAEIIRHVNSLKIIKNPVSKKENSDESIAYTIQYSGSDPDRFRGALDSILSTANEEVWSDLRELLNMKIESLENENKEKLQDIQNKIESLRVFYESNTASRLAFLKEQSLIAHALDIEKNTISGQEVSIGSGSLAAIERDIPEYLRGYKAIDKEIELIEARVNEESFIPGLPKLRMEIAEIQRNNETERIRQVIDRSPIGHRADFMAAAYDLNKLHIRSAVRSTLVMVLGLILGVIFGLFALGIKNIISGRSQPIQSKAR